MSTLHSGAQCNKHKASILGWYTLLTCGATPCWKAGLNRTVKGSITVFASSLVHGIDIAFFFFLMMLRAVLFTAKQKWISNYSVSIESREIKRIFMLSGVVSHFVCSHWIAAVSTSIPLTLSSQWILATNWTRAEQQNLVQFSVMVNPASKVILIN